MKFFTCFSLSSVVRYRSSLEHDSDAGEYHAVVAWTHWRKCWYFIDNELVIKINGAFWLKMDQNEPHWKVSRPTVHVIPVWLIQRNVESLSNYFTQLSSTLFMPSFAVFASIALSSATLEQEILRMFKSKSRIGKHERRGKNSNNQPNIDRSCQYDTYDHYVKIE